MPDAVHGWNDTPQGYGIYELFDQGIMFEGAFVPPEFASIAFPFAGRAFTDVMEQYQRMALFGLLVSDAPNGRVYRKSDGSPLITYWLGKRRRRDSPGPQDVGRRFCGRCGADLSAHRRTRTA